MSHTRNRASRIALSLALCLSAGLLLNGVAAGAADTTPAGGPSITAVPVTAKYSPLGAIANGSSGPANARFTATGHCCPIAALVLTPTQTSTDADLQWMTLGLPWDNTTVSSLTVCYAISTTVVGRSYISQTRVTNMTTPNASGVMIDDGTDRTAVGPACYTIPAASAPSGAMTLQLRVVFGSTADRITIGMVSVSGTSE